MTRGVTIYHKVLAGIWRSKHRSRNELVLKSLKAFLAFICPLKLNAFVKQISQGLGNLGEVLDETEAITSKSKKASDLLDSLWRGPVKNSLNALWVDGNTILGDNMTKVGDFGKPEFALGILGIKLMLSKLL